MPLYFVTIDELQTKQNDNNILNANKMPALSDMDLLITAWLLFGYNIHFLTSVALLYSSALLFRSI